MIDVTPSPSANSTAVLEAMPSLSMPAEQNQTGYVHPLAAAITQALTAEGNHRIPGSLRQTAKDVRLDVNVAEPSVARQADAKAVLGWLQVAITEGPEYLERPRPVAKPALTAAQREAARRASIAAAEEVRRTLRMAERSGADETTVALLRRALKLAA